MLSRIASILCGKNGTQRGDAGAYDRRVIIAACVLLLEMAKADEEFSSSELDTVRGILVKELGLPPGEVEEIMSIASREQEESADLWKFTNLINNSFDKSEKLGLVEMIWAVAYADGRLDKHEDYLVHKLANLLNISHSELIGAKLKVLEHGSGDTKQQP